MDASKINLVNHTAQILLQSIRELRHLVIVSPQSLSSSSSSQGIQDHYQCNENGTFTDIILSNSSTPTEKVLLKTQALAIPDLHVMIYAKRLDDKSEMKNLDIELQKYISTTSSSSSSSLLSVKYFPLSTRLKEGLLYGLFDFAGEHASLDGLSVNTLCEITSFLPIKDIINLHSLNKLFQSYFVQPKTSSNNTDNNNNNDYATISQAMWIKYLQRDFPSVIMKDGKSAQRVYEEAFTNAAKVRQQRQQQEQERKQQQRVPPTNFIPPRHDHYNDQQRDGFRVARDLGLLDGGGVGRSQEATTEEILFGLPRLGGSGQPLPGYTMPQPRRLPPDMLGEPDMTGMLPGFAGMPAMPGTAHAPEPYDRLRADPPAPAGGVNPLQDDPLRIGGGSLRGRGRGGRNQFGGMGMGGLRDDASPFGGPRRGGGGMGGMGGPFGSSGGGFGGGGFGGGGFM